MFVQTSAHEGFCLPPLEAMATGGAVVCTDAHGNRDFCRDGENCLVPEARPEQVSDAISRGCSPIPSCARAWARRAGGPPRLRVGARIDALEAFLEERRTTGGAGELDHGRR